MSAAHWRAEWAKLDAEHQAWLATQPADWMTWDQDACRINSDFKQRLAGIAVALDQAEKEATR